MNKRTNDKNDPSGPTDRVIGEALRSLPRTRARAGFARELLARLPEEAGSRPLWGSPKLGLLAAVFATALIATFVLSTMLRGPNTRSAEHASTDLARAETTAPVDVAAANAASAADARLRELLAERQALLAELDKVRRAATPRPLLYLGGDESVDLVVDLSRVARRRPTSDARPAVYPRR